MFGLIGSVIGGLFARNQQKKAIAAENAALAEQRATEEANAKVARENSINDIIDALPRMRKSAEAAGFNPLSALQNGAANSLGVHSGVPASVAPLASTRVAQNNVQDVFSDIGRFFDQRKAEKSAKAELEAIYKETAAAGGASGIVGRTTRAVSTPGAVTMPRPTNVASVNTKKPRITAPGDFGQTPNMLSPEREKDVMSVANTSGVFEMQNKITGDNPIILPGDSEPWGIDELGTAVVVGLPQIAYRGAQKIKDYATGQRGMDDFVKTPAGRFYTKLSPVSPVPATRPPQKSMTDAEYRRAYRLNASQNNNVQ